MFVPSISSRSQIGKLSCSPNPMNRFNINKNINTNSSISCTRKISASFYANRIHAAKSAGAVSSIIAMARSDMSFVRSSGASEDEVKKALQILNQAIAMGNQKMAKLAQEKQMESKKLTVQKKEKKQIEKALKKKKNIRELQESAVLPDHREVSITKHTNLEDVSILLPGSTDYVQITSASTESVPASTESGVESSGSIDVQV